MTLSVKLLMAALAGFLLGGCVTTVSGGIPEPAPAENRIKARLDLARGYINEQSWVDAKRSLLKALEIDPRSAEAHVLLAHVYEAQGEPPVAESHFRKALRIERDNSQAMNNYGTFLARQGRHEDAAEMLRKVVQDTDYRARPRAYENLGLAELELNNRTQAQAAFERALSLDPRLAVSNLELSYLALDDARLKDALTYFEAYRQLARQSARSLCLGMKLGSAVGNVDQVASYGLALKNLFPESREARECQVTNP